MSQYLSEAFKRLDILNEETFSISNDGIADYQEFVDTDEIDDTVDVIDMEAETEDDIQDSYVGKVILDCCVCHSKIYKDVEDVVIEDDLANVGEECPFCYTPDGYKVIGQVAEFTDNEDSTETNDEDTNVDTEKETESEKDVVNEGIFNKKDQQLYDVWEQDQAGDKQWTIKKGVTEKEANKIIDKIIKKEPHRGVWMAKQGLGPKEDASKDVNEGLFDKMAAKKHHKIMADVFSTDYNTLVNNCVSVTLNGLKALAKKNPEDYEMLVNKFAENKSANVIGDVSEYCDDCTDAKKIMSTLQPIYHDKDDKKFDAMITLVNEVNDIVAEKVKTLQSKDSTNEGLFSKKSDKASTVDVWVQMDGKKWITYKNIPSDKVEPYVKDSENAFKGNNGFKVWTEPHNPKAWAKCFDLKGNLIKNPIPEGLFGKKKERTQKTIKAADLKKGMILLDDDREIKVQSTSDDDGTHIAVGYKTGSMSIPKHHDVTILEGLTESVNSINVETDTDVINVTPDENGKVTVSTEPRDTTATDGEETIQPLEPEVQDEIDSNVSDGEEIEIDVDEFDEESFDNLGEGYLKKVYENVNSFKTSNVSFIKDKLIVEGVINFTSGKSKKTNFIFGIREATKSGKIRFIGENKEIARGRKSFTVTGKLEGNKFLSESLNYNYGVKNAQGKAQRLYGTIKNSKRG